MLEEVRGVAELVEISFRIRSRGPLAEDVLAEIAGRDLVVDLAADCGQRDVRLYGIFAAVVAQGHSGLRAQA